MIQMKSMLRGFTVESTSQAGPYAPLEAQRWRAAFDRPAHG